MTNINSMTGVPAGTGAGTAAETVWATLPVISVGAQQPIGVVIRGWIVFAAGATCTSVTFRCRQGSLTGQQVDAGIVVPVTAGASESLGFSFHDTSAAPGQLGGIQYVLTSAPNGSGASTLQAQVTVEV